MSSLEIRDLHVSVEGKEILKGVNLEIKAGEVHALMGPNGSGKSTLAHAVMGHPKYQVTKGSVLLDGKELLGLAVDKRARAGVFLAFQRPEGVPGVQLGNFILTALNAREEKPDVAEFNADLKKRFKNVRMDYEFSWRSLNDGLSGGEQKRSEIIQMEMLSPKLAILDEPDSGLDVDGVKVVAKSVSRYAKKHKEAGVLLITHYQRILKYVDALTHVHILIDGRVATSGGPDLAKQVEERGYDWLKKPEVAAT
ncbi:MAG TPA: Fe-S cluster assembly ATPase SufC [Thermoplasmata archaeon]|nr:Fe-S cluster assembly ATPase SufC [Thermoplasmata archaeon]